MTDAPPLGPAPNDPPKPMCAHLGELRRTSGPMPGVWLVCSGAMAVLSPIPLDLLLLLRVGVLDVWQLRHYHRHANIVILIFAMFLTPPDPVTQLLMAVPMYALYELCILFAPRRRTAGPRDG